MFKGVSRYDTTQHITIVEDLKKLVGGNTVYLYTNNTAPQCSVPVTMTSTKHPVLHK